MHPRNFAGTDGRFATPWTRCKHTQCPHCGSSHVDRRTWEGDAGFKQLDYHCYACGKLWRGEQEAMPEVSHG